MRNVKKFNQFYLNESDSVEKFKKNYASGEYKLLTSSGAKNPENDEDEFWFSTKDDKKSLVLNCFLEIISNSIDKLKGKDINSQNFYCVYKQGDKNIIYTYRFWTPDEDVVKKSENKYEGHEWQLDAEIPSDIIEKLNTGKITTEEAKKRIDGESSWALYDGMDAEGFRTGEKDGWQLSYIMDVGDVNNYIEQQKKSRAWQPQWLKNFATWVTDKFA
jgi:hypothetical protein